MAVRFSELIVDSTDPRRLAEFWAAVLGWQTSGPDDAGVWRRMHAAAVGQAAGVRAFGRVACGAAVAPGRA